MVYIRPYSVESNNMPVCYPACDGGMVTNTWHVWVHEGKGKQQRLVECREAGVDP
jgi:hypothetical protein